MHSTLATRNSQLATRNYIMSFITIENVHKTYKTGASEVHALNGVSLQIEKGEHVAIMGKSGSGKSTLLHVLAGLTRFDSGTISIDGNSVGAMSDAALTRFRREKIGLIFQAFNLIPTLTAEENILLPLIAGGKTDFDKERLEMLLTRLEIADRRAHRPDALSGGEQQRVAVARALMSPTDILLADEPTGNLDTDNSMKLCQILKELCKDQGRTLLVVTHEKEVAAFADRVITLKDGKIENESVNN